MLRYVEYAPSAALKSDVVAFWTLENTGQALSIVTVLPDACVDLIYFDHREPALIGPATRVSRPIVPPRGKIVGVRFQPGSASRFVKREIAWFRDGQVPLAEFDVPRLAPGSLARSDPEALVDALMRELTDRATAWRTLDPDVVELVRSLREESRGRIDDLARTLSSSPRQLHRLALRAVGQSPKQLQSVLRAQRVLQLGVSLPLAALAQEAGYADQAHMTRELRRLFGATPRALVGHVPSAFALAAQ